MHIIITSNSYSLPKGATNIDIFPEKDKFVDEQGKITQNDDSAFRVIAKYEKSISLIARIFKVTLGMFIVFTTLGCARKNARVQALFKNKSSTLIITKSKTEESKKHQQLPYPVEKDPAQTEAIPAILYTSMAGNPVHKGHMGMIATAIEGLRKKNIPVEKVCVSLSYESYLRNKVSSENQKIKNENAANNTKVPVKVLLSRDARVRFLEAAIKESSEKFAGVKVEYWNDQDKGESDHPESYSRLVKEMPRRRVYFIGGTDLCNNMKNWHGKSGNVSHAIIVTRMNERPDIQEESTESYSRQIFEGAKEYQAYSSTAIQKERKFELLPESVREEFSKLHTAAQNGK